MQFRLHAFEPFSLANGPGKRAVVWFQGCSLGCSGCFNVWTHDLLGGIAADTADVIFNIQENQAHIEGVTFSGGEPFLQSEAMLEILEGLRAIELSVLVFSGYTRQELEILPLGKNILAYVDVLIAGRYREKRHVGKGLVGSSNQRIHLLTNRYHHSDLDGIPAGELILHRDGTMTVTGIAPVTIDEQAGIEACAKE